MRKKIQIKNTDQRPKKSKLILWIGKLRWAKGFYLHLMMAIFLLSPKSRKILVHAYPENTLGEDVKRRTIKLHDALEF